MLQVENKFIIAFLWLSFIGCTKTKPLALITVTEKDGYERKYQYVTANVPIPTHWENTQALLAMDQVSQDEVPVQILDSFEHEEKSYLKVVFPLSVEANSTKILELNFAEEENREIRQPYIELSNKGHAVENKIYKINFSTDNDSRGGQIDGILLKNFKNRLLKRTHIAMHWAPNFAKTDIDGYYNLEDLSSTSNSIVEKGTYLISKTRSGKVDEVPEIFVESNYFFYADLPFFISQSVINMQDTVSLSLLRNDEMTMDSLFTHVSFQKRDGTISSLRLYHDELDSLEKNPIPDDSGFVAFYNNKLGYGLASIRLTYENTDINGLPSPTHKPHTKISKSRGNGRYWNRVLLDSNTIVPKGSKYFEKNAYLIFKVGEEVPEKEILYYSDRLRHPLEIVVLSAE